MTIEDVINVVLENDIVMIRHLEEDNIMRCLYFGRKEDFKDESIKHSKILYLSSEGCTVTNADTGKSESETTILLYI